MGRRSDHSRAELQTMIVAEGHRQMSEVGYAHFSAREVAKRIGYSVGTIYNVFGSLDMLVVAINGRTLDQWRHHLEQRLETTSDNRLHAAIEAYFEYAILHRHGYEAKLTAIIEIVVAEVAAALPDHAKAQADALARSLLATVHGHCFFTLNGTFALLGESDPLGAAYARVQEAIAAASQ
jgi:AcrR family transcriptional regulator